jgi:hypothetical protein
MGGGREIPILTSTPAIVGTGMTIANASRITPKNNFFILLPPYFGCHPENGPFPACGVSEAHPRIVTTPTHYILHYINQLC